MLGTYVIRYQVQSILEIKVEPLQDLVIIDETLTSSTSKNKTTTSAVPPYQISLKRTYPKLNNLSKESLKLCRAIKTNALGR